MNAGGEVMSRDPEICEVHFIGGPAHGTNWLVPLDHFRTHGYRLYVAGVKALASAGAYETFPAIPEKHLYALPLGAIRNGMRTDYMEMRYVGTEQ